MQQTKLSLAAIKELCNSNPDCYFFSKDTMKFYRKVQAKYTTRFINGINYVVVSKILFDKWSHAYYELVEEKGRFHLKYISALPEKL